MYKCISCGKEVKITLKDAKKVQCPYCGYRIIEKTRSNIVKRLKVR